MFLPGIHLSGAATIGFSAVRVSIVLPVLYVLTHKDSVSAPACQQGASSIRQPLVIGPSGAWQCRIVPGSCRIFLRG